MAYWLYKTEPGNWSWDDQKREGDKGTHWDGVRNHQAQVLLFPTVFTMMLFPTIDYGRL